MKSFEEQALTSESNIIGNENAVETTKRYVMTMDETVLRKWNILWGAITGTSPMQMVSRNILPSLSNEFQYATWYEMCKQWMASMLCSEWRW